MISPSRYLGPSCVLVSDDDAGGPDFLVRLLRATRIGNDVVAYPRTKDAVKFLRLCLDSELNKRPKLILLAVQEPEETGFETVEWIRSNAAFDETVLIMLCPGSDVEYAQCARRMGVDALLEKYPGPNLLRIVVSRALRHRTRLSGKPEPAHVRPSKRAGWFDHALRSLLARSSA